MAFKFQSPLVFIASTGFTVDPNNTELFGNVSPSQTTTFSIGQAVSTGSNVQFNQVTPTTEEFIIDNEDLFLKDGEISGSLTVSSNTTIAQKLTGSQDLTILGILTAEKIETELTQSVTLFESGSTIFGDTSDDTHQFSGSILSSGSLKLVTSISEISNDTSLADSNASAIVTEKALRNYLDDNVDDIQLYLRKSFTHTGSFVSTSTSSFTAISASAPSGYTATSEDDFMFFINGQLMEHDAIAIEQSSSVLLLKVDNDSLGYDLESKDEIVAWGKFDTSYSLTFSGDKGGAAESHVTTDFNPDDYDLNLGFTVSYWIRPDEVGTNMFAFGRKHNNNQRFVFGVSQANKIHISAGSNKLTGTWGQSLADNASGKTAAELFPDLFTHPETASDSELIPGTWIHFVVTYEDRTSTDEGSVSRKVYLNGELIRDANINWSATGGGTGGMYFGARNLTAVGYNYGMACGLDEIAIFGEEKDSDWVTSTYNGGTPNDLTEESGLVGYWRFEEGGGTTVKDLSGEGNHGTFAPISGDTTALPTWSTDTP
jgi:hypothetical protein